MGASGINSPLSLLCDSERQQTRLQQLPASRVELSSWLGEDTRTLVETEQVPNTTELLKNHDVIDVQPESTLTHSPTTYMSEVL